MKNYFYNLNKIYLESFRQNVINKFTSYNFKTDENFLKVIFTEINNLFSHLGGRTSSKKYIPKTGEYPDSSKFNKLIDSIHDDVNKLYTAQQLIADDLNNLLNFNSNQRESTFEEVVNTQQNLMNLYIKHKKDISGEFVVKTDFQSQSSLGSLSSGVEIDQVRGVLTLASSFIDNKPIDTDNVVIYFSGKKPSGEIYPNNNVLYPGSHWKIPGYSTSHHIDVLNPSALKNYKRMMIDDQNVNTGVGWTEYESVITELVLHTGMMERSWSDLMSLSEVLNIGSTFSNKGMNDLKREIGIISGLNKDPEFIYADMINSLQGRDGYLRGVLSTPTIQTDQQEKYKLIIPFNSSAKLTNEIAIGFSAIESDIPIVLWNESTIYSNTAGRELSYPIINPADSNAISDDGYYICKLNNYIVPSRLELILTFGGDPWHAIPFEMAHYVYSMSKPFNLPQQNNENVSFMLGRSYDVFVDSEPNESRQKARALNVLKGVN